MPRNRPPTTGYERLAQADHFSDDSDDDILAYSSASLQPQSGVHHGHNTQPGPHSGMTSPKVSKSARHARTQRARRLRSNSGVDLKAINARLERWAEEIAAKFKRGKGRDRAGEEERLEIVYSVFHPPSGVRPVTAEAMAAMPPPEMSKHEFDTIVQSVRTAIDQGMHPSMITQGSSGSYFARNTDGKIVGVFKPKDEEPYAAGNPKWNKWIHRNLFPCFFGRACLIPNLSYVSEAAAYTLDCQLRTHIVPYTDVVHLSSKSFHYPFWDRRRAARKNSPLPSKPGSFQVFLKGFKDANVFLRENPWPDQYYSGSRANETHRNKRRRWAESCRPNSRRPNDHSESDDEGEYDPDEQPLSPDNFRWTETLKQSFREQLEKLVILDYIMRNTDRGLDNWMVKVDWESQAVSIASDPPQMNMDVSSEDQDQDQPARPVNPGADAKGRRSNPYKAQMPMNPNRSAKVPEPKISVGAIDNSLSWPWKHPDAWRSFPFGWLFLPVDLIGHPFSQATRDHFLPLLTSTQWWSETQLALRKVFQLDQDFQEKMFQRQIAVMKGQAWNVVETLKTPDHGPLELTRRAKVCVWDDLIDVPIAVPMRVPSAEMRRKAEPALRTAQEEEMDIGAANTSSSPAYQEEDLIGSPSPLPHPGRFDIASSRATSPDGLDHPTSKSMPVDAEQNPFDDTSASSRSRPAAPRSGARASYQGPPRSTYGAGSPSLERRFSFAHGTGRRDTFSIAQQIHGDRLGYGEYDDDMDGDLGYAAAEDMDGNKRKVIVERLETLKTRNPVFTWC